MWEDQSGTHPRNRNEVPQDKIDPKQTRDVRGDCVADQDRPGVEIGHYPTYGAENNIPESETIGIAGEGQSKLARKVHHRHSKSCMWSSILIDRNWADHWEALVSIQKIGSESRALVQHIDVRIYDLWWMKSKNMSMFMYNVKKENTYRRANFDNKLARDQHEPLRSWW
jgi:hypothetical protein